MPAAPAAWTFLAEGLDLGRFPTGRPGPGGDQTVVILRIDPERWELTTLCASATDGGQAMTARDWCASNGLVAAINAGMYASDLRTHVGYLYCGGHVNSAQVTRYQSVATFAPLETGAALFRIWDLDAPGVSLEKLKAGYRCVAQNLRMIKRPGRNAWSRQEKRWSEVALGEDAQGRALFIFCRTGYTMHEFNKILLELPIRLVSAQHLDGGRAAEMYVNAGGTELELVGCWETGHSEHDRRHDPLPLPNVFGVRARAPSR